MARSPAAALTRRHDSPSPPRKRDRDDSPSPPGQNTRRSDSLSSASSSDHHKKKHDKKDNKKKAKKEAKRQKKETKKLKKQQRKERHGAKKDVPDHEDDGADARPPLWALEPPEGLTTTVGGPSLDGGDAVGSKVVVVAFGEGGSITYPPGYAGPFELGRVELWQNDDKSGGGGDGDHEDGGGGQGERRGGRRGGGGAEEEEEEEEEGEGGRGFEGAEQEVPVAALIQAGNASGFFAQLLAQEQAKPAVGTLHASGKKDEFAVSGQGIMAGVRTSTIRPTGMGGGAIPHDQITGDNGEWSCLKCGRSNGRSDGSCKNCSALRRMVRG